MHFVKCEHLTKCPQKTTPAGLRSFDPEKGPQRTATEGGLAVFRKINYKAYWKLNSEWLPVCPNFLTTEPKLRLSIKQHDPKERPKRLLNTMPIILQKAKELELLTPVLSGKTKYKSICYRTCPYYRQRLNDKRSQPWTKGCTRWTSSGLVQLRLDSFSTFYIVQHIKTPEKDPEGGWASLFPTIFSGWERSLFFLPGSRALPRKYTPPGTQIKDKFSPRSSWGVKSLSFWDF